MKNRILCVVFVWVILTAQLLGCEATELRKDAEEQNSKAISVVDLDEDMQTGDTEKSRPEDFDLQIVECDERTEAAGTALPTDSETGDNALTHTAETDDTPRMLRVNGEIYYDTGRISDALRCGLMDGVIDSSVSEGETPTENNQSNFGTGYGYQRWMKGQVHVNIDDTWHIFQTSETYRLTVTNGNNGELVELERSPAFWEIIEKYQNLDVTSQNKQADRTGYSYCLRLYDKEDTLIATATPMGREINLDGEYYSDNGYGTVAELQLALDALFEGDFPEATATERAFVQDKTSQGVNGNQVATEDIDVLEDVYMSVTYATEKGANLVLMNYSDKNMQCGDDYELQMLKDGEWYQVDYIIDNWAFNAIAYMMPKNEPVSMCIDWTHFHGVLPAGQYRIVKSVMDFRGAGDYTTYRLGAEFDI